MSEQPEQPPRVPVVDRIAQLEQALSDLITRHNQFVSDVRRELGL